MKRISLILASLVLLFSTKASALVGGPFDNGDFNASMDNQGIYQAAFRFSNGSGFAQFGNNVDPTVFTSSTAAGTAAPNTAYSILNRSLIYYKGVTYLGTCMGMVDHESKIVQGVTNGNSDLSSTATAAAAPSSATGGTTFANTSNLVTNGLGYPCNSNFVCKITKSYPILKFQGTGELTIINPTLAQVTFTAISAAISRGSIQGGNAAVTVTVGEEIQDIIAASQLPGILDQIPNTRLTEAASDHAKMTVFGSRIFFLGTR